MFNIKRVNRIAVMVAGGFILLGAGCHSSSQQSSAPLNHGEEFAPEGSAYKTQVLEQTQEAAGARADDTLYPQHFDGPGLSTLGTTKLDAVLADSHSCNPLTIYLAVPADDMDGARRRAVSEYLIHHGGLKPEQVAFQTGPQTSTYAPAAPSLKNYDKTDTGSSDSAASSSSASSSH